jgi:serine O-acetyltransferase
MSDLTADLRRWCDAASPYQDTRWRWRLVARAVVLEQGAWAVIAYRYRRWARTRSWPYRLLGLVVHKLVEITTGISISVKAEIGPGLFIAHFGGIVIGNGVVMGENCSLCQGVTVGSHKGTPTLGDRVFLAPGCKVFGPIIMGDDSKAGANAVVHHDVPQGNSIVNLMGGTSRS